MINKFLISLAIIAAITFGGVANANHISTLIKGALMGYSGASFCYTEESAVSILRDLEENGMESSVKVYKKLIDEGSCIRDNVGGTFIPIRLVRKVGDAIVVEVILRGVPVYFVSPAAQFIVGGNAV
ncbi:MAG: hypothetical protein QQN63_13095 [Nitrosopumilus sp.]